jgi:hypothetical protein
MANQCQHHHQLKLSKVSSPSHLFTNSEEINMPQFMFAEDGWQDVFAPGRQSRIGVPLNEPH